jgi:hypothetical protein
MFYIGFSYLEHLTHSCFCSIHGEELGSLQSFPIKQITFTMASDEEPTEITEITSNEQPSSPDVEDRDVRTSKRARIPNSVSCNASSNEASNELDHLMDDDSNLPSQTHRLRIQQEKQYVKLVRRIGMKGMTSPVWKYDYFRIASLIDNWEEKEIGKICSLQFYPMFTY